MSEKAPQSYAHHTKRDPWFHFFLAPVSGLMLLTLLWKMYREPSLFWLFLIGWMIVFIVLIFKTRLYALKLQDRVIRLEERVRLAALLPEAMRPRIGELNEAQLIALRFASDAELPELAQSAIKNKLSKDDIKKLVKDWRPDHWRV